jgi:hypothetical protein
MPLLNQTYVAFIGVVVLIIIGIVAEKKKVVWETAFANVISFLLVLGSVDLGIPLTIAFLVYMITGLAVIYYKLRAAYFLFGFKTYGAFSLTLLLASLGYYELGITAVTFDQLFKFVGVWATITMVIYFLGFLYSLRK